MVSGHWAERGLQEAFEELPEHHLPDAGHQMGHFSSSTHCCCYPHAAPSCLAPSPPTPTTHLWCRAVRTVPLASSRSERLRVSPGLLSLLSCVLCVVSPVALGQAGFLSFVSSESCFKVFISVIIHDCCVCLVNMCIPLPCLYAPWGRVLSVPSLCPVLN